MKRRNAILLSFLLSLILAMALPASAPVLANGLLFPEVNPDRGRKLFATKGCVVCHQVNGIGGEDAPSLDMSKGAAMNPFDFAAKMWRGADAMIAMQEDELGEKISLTGQNLADIISFTHSSQAIKKFSEADIPKRIKDIMQ